MAGIQIFNPTAPDFGDANTLLMSGLKGLSSSFDPFAEQINKNQTTADTNLLGLLQQAATQYGVGTPEFMAAEENLRGLNPNANVDEFKYAGVLDTARLNAQNSTQADLLADKTRADINSVQYNDQNVIAETAGRKLLNVGQETKNVQEQGQLAEQSLFNQLAAELNNPNRTPEEKQTIAASMAKQFQFSDISKLISENRTQTHTEDNNSNDSVLRALALGVNASQAANQGAGRQFDGGSVGAAFNGATGGGTNNSVVKSSPTQTTSTTGSSYNVVGKIDYNGKPIQANANRDKYMNSIVNAARYHGVDPAFALAKFHTESDFNPLARSGAGATGIAQLMGPTAKEMGVQDINDPEQNIVGGIKYIASLMKRYNGDMRAVTMAYNMGPNAYDNKPPGQETRNHAERVLNRYNSYQGSEGSGGNGAANLQSAASGKAQTANNGKHIKYVNSKADRNQKLDSGLVNSLSFLGGMGVTMEVHSGGQSPKGSGGKHVGSTAHDHGHAGDGVLKYQGRTLDWNKKEDKAILSKVVEEAAANGINGFGAGYMGKGIFHFGKQAKAASWGGGGTEKSKGFSWVNDAIKRGTARYQANGGAAGQATSNAFSQGLSNTPDMLAAAEDRINTRNDLLAEQGDMGNQFLKLLSPNGELDTPQTNSIYDAYNSAVGMVSSANEAKVRDSAIKDQEAINAQASLQAQAAQENSIDLSQLIGPDDKQHFYAFLKSKGLDPEKLQRMGPNDMDIMVDNWFSYIQPIKEAEYDTLDKSATYLSNKELAENFKNMKRDLSKKNQKSLQELTKGNWDISVTKNGNTFSNLLTSAVGLTDTHQDTAAAPHVVPMKIISNMERELANNKEMYGATFSASTGTKIATAVKGEMDTWIMEEVGDKAYRDYTKSGKLPTKDNRSAAQIESDFKKYGTKDFSKIVTDKLNNLTVQIMRNTAKRSVIETRERLEKLQQQRVGVNYYKTAKDTRKALTQDARDSKRKN